jgi:hypothetical protein
VGLEDSRSLRIGQYRRGQSDFFEKVGCVEPELAVRPMNSPHTRKRTHWQGSGQFAAGLASVHSASITFV